MKERIKIIAGVLSFAMVFGIFASCGGNSNSADENSDSISDTAEIPNSSVETVESPWTEEPEIKSVFFSIKRNPKFKIKQLRLIVLKTVAIQKNTLLSLTMDIV